MQDRITLAADQYLQTEVAQRGVIVSVFDRRAKAARPTTKEKRFELITYHAGFRNYRIQISMFHWNHQRLSNPEYRHVVALLVCFARLS